MPGLIDILSLLGGGGGVSGVNTPDQGGGGLFSGLSQWAGDHSNQLTGLGAGILSGDSWSSGLASGFQQGALGKRVDRKDAKDRRAENATTAWLATQQLSPEQRAYLEANPDAAATLYAQQTAPKAPIKLGEGDQLLDPTNYNVLAQGQPKSGSAPTTREFNVGGKNVVQQYDPMSKAWQTVGDAPVQNRDTPPGFSAEQQLASQFQSRPSTQNFQNQQYYYKRMAASYADAQKSAAAGQGTGAADIGMVYGYMKMLDPGSAVMQGEQANAQNAGGVSEAIRNLYNSTLKGDKLPEQVRRDFIRNGGALVNAAGEKYSTDVNQIREQAKRYGLNPDNVGMPFQPVPIEGGQQAAQPAPQATQSTAQQQPVPVRTPEEAMQLPPGTPIQLPDGTIGVVPAR